MRWTGGPSCFNRMAEHRAAASRSLDRNQLVLNIMQLNESRSNGAVFEVKAGRFAHIGPELFPCLSLCEDRMPQSLRTKAAFFRVANLEDQFHPIQDTHEPIRVGSAQNGTAAGS